MVYQRSRGQRLDMFVLCNTVFMVVFTLCMIYPFYSQFVIAFNEGSDAVRGGVYLWPRKFTLDNYRAIFSDKNLIRAFGVSIARTGIGTVTSLFCTSLLGYIITIPYFSGKKFMRIFSLFSMYFSGGLIAFYLLMASLKLTETFTVYWITSLISPYYMLLLASYIQGIPNSVFESARMDGANEFKVYWHLVIPMAIPALAAVAVYTAVGQWNAWFDTTIYNPSGKFDTLQVYLRRLLLEADSYKKIEDATAIDQIKKNTLTSTTIKAATTMVATIPILLVYPFFQKYFVGGITMGAVKE